MHLLEVRSYLFLVVWLVLLFWWALSQVFLLEKVVLHHYLHLILQTDLNPHHHLPLNHQTDIDLHHLCWNCHSVVWLILLFWQVFQQAFCQAFLLKKIVLHHHLCLNCYFVFETQHPHYHLGVLTNRISWMEAAFPLLCVSLIYQWQQCLLKTEQCFLCLYICLEIKRFSSFCIHLPDPMVFW